MRKKDPLTAQEHHQAVRVERHPARLHDKVELDPSLSKRRRVSQPDATLLEVDAQAVSHFRYLGVMKRNTLLFSRFGSRPVEKPRGFAQVSAFESVTHGCGCVVASGVV